MDGKELTHFSPVGKPGNIDVRYGFDLAGRQVDIVALNLRRLNTRGAVKLPCYAINPDYTSGEDVLTTLCDGRSEGNDIQKNAYGFTLYKNKDTGKMYCFEAPDDKPYNIRQYLIESNSSGTAVTTKAVRVLNTADLLLREWFVMMSLVLYYRI